MGKSVRKIPTFEEVMQDEPPKRKIPSYDEVMGEPVKKKEEPVFPLLYTRQKSTPLSANLKPPSTGGTSGLTPLPELPERQKKMIEDRAKLEQDPEIKEDPDDPIKSAMQPIREDLGKRFQQYMKVESGPKAESVGQKSLSKIQQRKLDSEKLKETSGDSMALMNLKKIQHNVEREVFPDAAKATELLTNYAKNKGIDVGDLMHDETIKNLPTDNETVQAGVRQIEDYRKIVKQLHDSGGSIEDAAINDMRGQSPWYDEKVRKLMEDNKYDPSYAVNIPESERGRLVYSYLQNPNLALAVANDPDQKQRYEDLKANVLVKYPSFGKTLVANELSQAREDAGKNNPILNVVGRETMDKIAAELYKDDPIKLKIYNETIRPDIRANIDTPGFVENLATSVKEAGQGLGQTFKELTPSYTDSELLRESTDKAATSVQVRPKGGLNTFGNISGKFAGVVLPIGYGGRLLQAVNLAKTPAAANAMMTGLTFFGQEKAHARELMPNDPAKQNALALGSTMAYMFASNIFKDYKALDGFTKNIRPDVAKTITDFTEGKINEAAAKDLLAGAFKEYAQKAVALGKGTLQQNTKSAIEMTAIQYAKNMMEKALSPETYDENASDQLLADTFVHTFLGTTPMGLSAAYSNIRQKPTVKDGIWDMANHKDRYEEAIKIQGAVDPSYVNVQDRLANLEYISRVKQELDRHPDLSTRQKKSFLLQSLNQKMLESSMPTEPTLQKKAKENIKLAEENKERILNGEDIDELPQEQKEILPDDKLEKELLKVAPEGYVEHHKALKSEGKEGGWLNYMAEKAAENPDKFLKEFGDDLFDQMIGKIGDKKLQNKLDYLTDNMPEDPNIPLLEQIIEERQAKKDKEFIESEEPVKKSKVSVIQPGEIKQPETTTIKPKENALPEQEADQVDVRQQARDGETVGEGNARPEEVAGEKENQTTGEEKPPISEPPAGAKIHVDRPATELSHKGLQDVANEFSLPDVQTRDRKTDIELRKEAQDTINEWVEKKEYSGKVDGLVKKAEAWEILTDKERVILEQHLSNISQELRELPKNSPEFDVKLAEVKRLKDAGEKTRSEAGAALRIPTFRSRPKDLAEYYVQEMEAAGVDKLTEQQKQTVEKEFNDISEAEKAYNEKIQALKDENAKLRAQIEIAKAGKQRGQKKDFKKEREDIFTSIQEKLKKARQDTQVTIVPYAKELIAIAPDVAKLVRSYAEQGVVELSEMIKKVHGDLKPVIEGITEKDVRDLIAGEYNEKKPSRDKLAETLRDLKDEAKLLNKLDELESGKEPTIEKKKVERNRKITDLKEKLKRHDLTRLAETKNRIKKQIEQIEKQIESGDFEKEKPPEIKLDKEAIELQNKLIQLRNERQKRLLIQEYEKSSKWNKIQTGAANILGVPRTIMASMDYSAPLRQALLPTLSHPGMASRAVLEMFRASLSQKNYDRWFDNLHNSERFKLMNDSKLAITDVNDPKLSAKEEQYMNGLAEKIPVIGKMIKGSERAYTIYLNKMRVDLFNRFADQMQKDGRTFENSPDQYKQMAAFVNNMTGRGDLGKALNEAAPVLNQLFFSPRLMASRMNTLTYLAQPRFWKKAPVEVRKDYFRNLIATAGIGLTILGLAKLAGADTEDDPRSPDFGKIKSGNTRWDIWGGHQQYIRVAAQLWRGETKSSSSGKIYELGADKPFGRTRGDVGLAFLRGKLAPIPSIATDIIAGRNAIGDKLTTNWKSGPKEVGIGENLASHLFPLTVTGMQEALQDQGAKAWFTVGVPSIFGVGTTTYETEPTNSKADKPGKEGKKDKK